MLFSCFPISCVLCIRSETAFDEYLQRDWRIIKSGNLARYVILSLVIWEFSSFTGGSQGSALCLSDKSVHWNRGCGVINAGPHLKMGVIITSIPLPSLHDPFLSTTCVHVSVCTVSMGGVLSFPWVTHLITAPSSLIPNSVGRACQTAYAERRGDFEMLLMTLGHNYPLSFTPPHSFFLVHSCHSHSRPSSVLFSAILLICWSQNAMQGRGC